MLKLTNEMLQSCPCVDCPFDGTDNVYCRTCSIIAAYEARTAHLHVIETLRELSDVVYYREEKRWYCVPPWLFDGCL